MHPDHSEVHLPHFFRVVAHHSLAFLRVHGLVRAGYPNTIRGDARRIQSIGTIPAGGI